MPGPDVFYIGAISMFTGDFIPRGWALCNGAKLAISQYQALYSVIGDYYGGDGRVYFALPNLQARLPIGTDNSKYRLGDLGGSFDITIPSTALPKHSHGLNVTAVPGQEDTGLNAIFASANSSIATQIYAPYDPSTTEYLDSNTISTTGTGQSFTHYPPMTTVNFCICMQGLYPPRP